MFSSFEIKNGGQTIRKRGTSIVKLTRSVKKKKRIAVTTKEKVPLSKVPGRQLKDIRHAQLIY